MSARGEKIYLMNENERSRAQQLNILLRNNPLYDIEPYLSQNRIKTSSKSSWSMKKEPNSIFSMLSKTMGRLSKSRRLRRAQKNRNSIRAARGSSQHTLARVRTGSLNIIDSAPTKAQVPIKKKSIHLPLNESTGISEEESDSISLPIRQKKFKEKRLDGLFVSVMITLFVNFPFGKFALDIFNRFD